MADALAQPALVRPMKAGALALLVVLAPCAAAAQDPQPPPASQPDPASQPAASQPSQPSQPPSAPGPLNPTQEIAKETPEGPALEVGPARIRIGGYLGVIGLFRSTNSGGAAATQFASTPYPDTVEGNVSESRLTAETSRLSIRVDAAPLPGHSELAGYFEMDFAGTRPGNVAVTSTSVGLRLRHAFGVADYHDRFFVAAGQAFSLMTPAKDQLSVWPSAFEMSYAVDTNYLAGLVWARTPQVRFTWRRSPRFNWAVSVENPEQQIGEELVKLPACCAGELESQYNTGNDQLSVPNLMPDIVTRAAINSGPLHVDVGGVFRVFRHTLAPYNTAFHHLGGGIGVNAGYQANKATKLVGQWSGGAGMGRYIGGLVPDVVVRADGTIDPIRTFSWVAGVERRVSDVVSLAGYYSGVLTNATTSVDADGTYIGYGYPGSPDSNNRRIHEATFVVAWQPWNIEGRGSMQLNIQSSWLGRTEFSSTHAAKAFLFFAQLRYNLP